VHDQFIRVLIARSNEDHGPIHISNFIEERKTTLFDCFGFRIARLIVDIRSAAFEFPQCRNIGLQRDHKHLNKFGNRDTDYRTVLDVIRTTIRNSLKLNTERSGFSEEIILACLQSLSFLNVDDRVNGIAFACEGTCDWLFTTPQFKQWQHRVQISSHNGVLWIKGNPGAGKSTLMKHALFHCKNTLADHADHSIAAYFFNARGNKLEKTFLGMLCSLLYQLLKNDPMLCDRFIPIFLDKQRKHGRDWQSQWHPAELKHFLLSEVKNGQIKSCFILVDALDECEESEVRQVVSFLESWSVSGNCINTIFSLNICLSSRHYPNINMEKRLELIVDKTEEHTHDIAKYIQQRLRIRDRQMEDELHRKAGGIFMWVVLVVERLNRAYDDGDVIAMKKTLGEVPIGLDETFAALFKGDDLNLQKTILMFQWVLFAERLLSPEELYFAVLAGTEPEELRAWDQSLATPELIRRYITSTSRGLVEVRKGGLSENVQFIHESVRDFLLRNKRLEMLDPTLGQYLVGASHDRLAACCMSYVMLKEIRPLLELPDNIGKGALAKEYPFLEYASRFILNHMEIAQLEGIEQHRLVMIPATEFEQLRIIHDIFNGSDFNDEYGIGAGLLYALSLHCHCALFQFVLPENVADANAQGGLLGNALQAASKGHSEVIVKLLLDNGADVNDQGGYYGNALQAAAWMDREAIVKLLLEEEANVNAEGGEYGNALQAAALNGSEGVVKLLLAKEADIHAQGGKYKNALEAALCRRQGNKEIVKLLLESIADVHTEGK